MVFSIQREGNAKLSEVAAQICLNSRAMIREAITEEHTGVKIPRKAMKSNEMTAVGGQSCSGKRCF